MFDRKTIAVTGAMFAVLVALILTRGNGPGLSGERQRELAIVLENKELYAQALEEYDGYLRTSNLNDESRAKIHHKTGTIYMDKLHDYDNALAAFVKVKHFDPKSELAGDAEKRMIECLDRVGRSLDAQQELERATAVDEKTVAQKGGAVVARIGARDITMEELEEKIERLPPYVQEQLQDPEARLELLKQYIATELFYDMAKRRGYDRDAEINQQTFEAKKGLMVEKLIGEEIRGTGQIDTSQARLYYQAHKADYQGPARVRIRHIQVGTQAKVQNLVERLARGEVFEKLAQAESEDVNSRPYGGELGYVTEDGLVQGWGQSEAIARAAFNTKVGKVSEPVKSEVGWHLIKVIERKEAGQLGFEEVANRVGAELMRQRQEETYQKMVDHALKAEEVQIFEDVLRAR